MKKLYFKTVMALVAGLFLFSCSSEDNLIDNNFDKNAKEEKAYRDLFVQLNALNEQYGAKDADVQTRVVGGGWLDQAFRMVPFDVAGTALSFNKDRWYRVVTSAVASIKANKLAQSPSLGRYGWKTNNMAAAYLARIGSTSANFDEVGDAHNFVVANIYDKYGTDGVKKLADNQLGDAVLQQMSQAGIPLPENFNSFTYVINYYYINEGLKNNYDRFLQTLVSNNFATNNEYNTLVSFLSGLSGLEKSNSLQYCVDFRNMVYNSGIPSVSISNICSAVSIGYASAHLWGN